jgi:hypothetical protein
VYLREAFQHRTGRLLPFLFVWTAMFTIPLIMSTGVIGLIRYLGYLIPDMSWVEIHGLSLIVVAIVLFSLYRRVAAVGAITTGHTPIIFSIVVIVAGVLAFLGWARPRRSGRSARCRRRARPRSRAQPPSRRRFCSWNSSSVSTPEARSAPSRSSFAS